MKRFFTLAALLVCMVSFAAPKPKAGRLIITNADNSIIQVRVDGRTYNVAGQPMILSNLAGGRHQLQIFKIERRSYGFGKAKSVLIYNAPVYVDQSFIVDVNVNRTGKVSIGKSIVMNNGPARSNRDDRYPNGRYDDNTPGYDRDGNDGYSDNRHGNGQYEQPKPSRPDRTRF
jgi:hypothetical protein